jgi:membrane protein YqaA with SNARE-associated domain
MKELLAKLVEYGPWGLFVGAFLDGAGVPVPGGVDVLDMFLAARRPDDVVLLALLAVLGSLMGNLVLFFLARKGGQLFLEKQSSGKRAKRFRAWFDHYGLLTVFISALVPLPVMPMKIFVFCSGAMGVTPWKFIAVFVAARLPRYFALAMLGRAMGDNALGYLKSHVWSLVAFAAALSLVLWLMIRWVDQRRARALGATVPAQS